MEDIVYHALSMATEDFRVANPLRMLAFSPDSALFASLGEVLKLPCFSPHL